ncbi:MAG: hypothetical protein IT260_08420, partial [Saprospiraceae bacterium]|nr:hypothetical protein [Saprospiraceae bacterium]
MSTRQLHTRLLLLTGVLLCLTALQSRAQGFIRQYPFFTWGQGGSQSVFPQADGSFQLTAVSYPDFGVDVQLHWLHADAQGLPLSDSILYTPYVSSPYYEGLYLLPAGGYMQATSDSNRVVVRRYDPAGAVVWENIQTLSGYYSAQVIVARGNDAGELFVRGAAAPLPNNLPDTGFVFKYAPDGNLLWKGWYNYAVTYVLPNSLVPTADGGCVFNNWGYYLSPDTINWEHLLRFDHNGNQVWKYGPLDARLFPHFSGNVFDTNAAGNTFAFFSETKNSMGPNPLRIDKISPAGALLDTF